MTTRLFRCAGRPLAPGSIGVLALATALLAGCGRGGSGDPSHDHAGGDRAQGEEHAEAAPRGPRGGRLFTSGDVQLELLIEETGIPPEFRAYLYDGGGRPVSPEGARLSVVLERFPGRRDSIPFRQVGDRFQSLRSVEEPHSFDARVALERPAGRSEWTYRQREGRVELLADAVTASGIQTGSAGPRAIEVRIEAPGEVHLNAERVVQVRPRFPGVIRALERSQGDRVRAGDRLAVVHSNESLADYDVFAPISGTVVARDVAPGQTVTPESPIYTLADLSTVWVDVALYPQVAGRVRTGQAATVRSLAGEPIEARGAIAYVGPLLEQDTRTAYGRVVLPNPGNRWQPGLFVTAAITVDRFTARVAVPEEAIVRLSRGPAVFRAEGTTFEAQPVTPGRSDGTWTEILEGLEPGARVVVRNAFLLKAELGRSEATHDH